MDLNKAIILLYLCVYSTYGQTIRQIIAQRPELVTLHDYIKDLSTYTQLESAGKKFTFFAPQNEAFLQIPNDIRSRYGPGSVLGATYRKDLNDIVNYHTVFNKEGSIYRLAELGDIELKTNAPEAAPLFFKMMENEQYVNGAKIVNGDIVASNGVVHIIDHFLYRHADKHKALSYVKEHTQVTDMDRRTWKFNKLLTNYAADIAPTIDIGINPIDSLNGLSDRVTLFLPSDEAMRNIDTTRLSNDKELLKKVVESHVITDDVYHESLLRQLQNQDIPAYDGDVVPKRFGTQLSVSNFCASGTIVHSNITVANGVVHIIDGLMGYVYNDIIRKMREIPDLSDFSNRAESSKPIVDVLEYLAVGSRLPENQMLTVFAPHNDAMRGHDITLDGQYLESTLKMHIIEGQLKVSQMQNDTVRRTLRGAGYDATFIRIERGNSIEIYIEVNNVRGRIREGDICTLNGMLHIVDHIIGMPTQTIFAYISDQDQDPISMNDLRRSISEVGLINLLDSRVRKLTMFAPVDDAFVTMREGELGRKLLQLEYQINLKNVLERHVVEREVIISDLNEGRNIIKSKFGDEFTIVKSGDKATIEFGTFKIRILQQDMRMVNGILHIIDRVLYDEGNPNSGEWASAASTNVPSFCAVLFISVCQLLRGTLL